MKVTYLKGQNAPLGAINYFDGILSRDLNWFLYSNQFTTAALNIEVFF